MASIIWSDVTAFAPELAAVAAGAQTDLLAYVNGDGVAVDVFGGEDSPTTRLARIYLAAHVATVGRFGAGAGPLTSHSAGGLSRSFAQFSGGGLIGTTGYGRLFLQLARPGAVGPMVL